MKHFLARLRAFFTPAGMLGKRERCGELEAGRDVYRNFMKLAWPAIAESMLSAMTGFVDTIMVGTVSDAAIAAVGLTTQPRMLFFSLFTTVNLGVLAVVARKKGEGDRKTANEALHQGLMLCALLSVFSLVISFLFAEPLMKFAGAEADTLGDAVEYFRIIMVGLCLYSFGLCINAAQRGASRTGIAFLTSAVVNGVNLVLNYFLIGGIWFFPRMEVKGAAIATLCGNIAGLVVALASLYRENGYLHLDVKRIFRFDTKIERMIWTVSSGVAAEQILLRIGFFSFAKIVAGLGTESFTAHQIGMNIVNLSFACGDGLGVAASALVGQNLGRGRPDMAIIYGKTGQRVGFAFSAVLFLLFSLFPRQIVRLFTDTESVVETTRYIMIFVALTATVQISQVIFSGCLRGAGDTKYMAVISLFSIALVRPVLSYVLCYHTPLGVIGAWISLFVDQGTRCLAASLRFDNGKWTKIRL